MNECQWAESSHPFRINPGGLTAWLDIDGRANKGPLPEKGLPAEREPGWEQAPGAAGGGEGLSAVPPPANASRCGSSRNKTEGNTKRLCKKKEKYTAGQRREMLLVKHTWMLLVRLWGKAFAGKGLESSSNLWGLTPTIDTEKKVQIF